ncbi:MAG: hypothetical protein FJ304_18320 [Planctomycetes bacterium]|nr:hypothetical protein [Planctomycetota bacterium]
MPRNPSGELVEREFLTLPVWDRLDAHTAETVARAVERCLREPWLFSGMTQHSCGGQERYIAFFDWNNTAFALIPGGEVTLGYEPNRHPPPANLLDRWRSAARAIAEHYPEWEGVTWERYLTSVLSPLRQVRLAPYLFAVRGEEKRRKTGTAERNAIATDGFQLPTADQWEFACSGGSRAVWNWGDDPTGGPHVRNAFGLWIVTNTYHQEALADPGYRGGDGGVRECGGVCQLEAFVPLSSWYISNNFSAKQEDDWHGIRYRRVFTLPESILG